MPYLVRTARLEIIIVLGGLMIVVASKVFAPRAGPDVNDNPARCDVLPAASDQ
jgi:hypothetical protein